MPYSKQEQSYTEINWFAIDKNGIVIHLNSGGGKLPHSIANIEEEQEDTVYNFFRALPFVSKSVNINESLEDLKIIESEEKRDRYLDHALQMAKRGLYSFDKSVPGDFSNEFYHLVAFPDNPINIQEIPDNVREILIRTRCDKDIREVFALAVTDVS